MANFLKCFMLYWIAKVSKWTLQLSKERWLCCNTKLQSESHVGLISLTQGRIELSLTARSSTQVQ